ncbi:type II toxin-antitoxin system RelE/ParE family toxin [Devosia sp. LjRoot16]|uniref:type II toxin-antitoxin system RelE/ParE family toxin n=1 Tax=Devosia sp. LjRoot16 TaxID=3342271 RepID=UPI003ECE2F18
MIAYRLSPAAEADLVGIWDYTAQQWGKDQAASYVVAIRNRLDGIVAGRIPLRSAADVRPGYFKCAAGSHMIYFTRASDQTIDVIRILHQSMDVAGLFRDGR